MTEDDCTVGGCTALIDAIHHIANVHKYARAEDVSAHAVFVITTDGMENASCRYCAAEVRKTIKTMQTERGWEFLFIDAVETAARFGIAEEWAVNYNADKKGSRVVYECVGKALGCVRANAPMSAKWSEEIAEDFASR